MGADTFFFLYLITLFYDILLRREACACSFLDWRLFVVEVRYASYFGGRLFERGTSYL